jgi:hypothetical protein
MQVQRQAVGGGKRQERVGCIGLGIVVGNEVEQTAVPHDAELAPDVARRIRLSDPNFVLCRLQEPQLYRLASKPMHSPARARLVTACGAPT